MDCVLKEQFTAYIPSELQKERHKTLLLRVMISSIFVWKCMPFCSKEYASKHICMKDPVKLPVTGKAEYLVQNRKKRLNQLWKLMAYSICRFANYRTLSIGCTVWKTENAFTVRRAHLKVSLSVPRTDSGNCFYILVFSDISLSSFLSSTLTSAFKERCALF